MIEVLDRPTAQLAALSGGDVIGSAGKYVDIARAILEDPFLPEVAAKIRELKRLETKKRGSGSGIGLRDLDTGLSLWIALKKRPWLLYVGAAVALAVPFAVGYFVARRSCSAGS